MGTEAFAIAAMPESMCFAPGDEDEGQRHVEEADGEGPAAHPAHVGDRAAGAHGDEEHGNEDGEGQDEPEEHHGRRLDLVHGHLDEHVRGAPDRGDDRKERQIPAGHRLRLAAVVSPGRYRGVLL